MAYLRRGNCVNQSAEDIHAFTAKAPAFKAVGLPPIDAAARGQKR
jgi:hypothetical protein